ncbi:MAG: oligoendopeptidase F [Clostridiales bacterium]|nr:oligoendopeptidase F [Clostridiales bacterium]
MKRSEVATKYKWDLESIYKTDEDWEKDFADIKSRMGELSAFEGKLNDIDTVRRFFVLSDDIDCKLSRLYAYAHMRKDENSALAKYVGMTDRAMQVYSAFSAESSFASPELISKSEEFLQELASHPSLVDYDYSIKELIRKKKHVLSDKEEKLMSMASVPLGGFKDIFGMADNVDLPLGTISVDGKKVQLTHGKYSQCLQHKDQSVRGKAFKTYYNSYEKLLNIICSTYAGSVKKDNFYARARGYNNCLEMKMYNENVPTAVYDNLLACVNKNLPILHKYVALRKKVLGLDTLNMYDMYVSVASADISVEFEEAFEIVKNGLAPLGKEYSELLQTAKDERWMDVYETENKRSGAYSSGSYGTKPFVLLNYSKTTHDVFTIAHELGHSIHSYYSEKNQPYPKSSYEIFVAEVASTVNEVLLLKHLISKAEDKELKKFLLSYYLDMFRTTLFRQTMFAEFEKIAHDADDNGQALTVDYLNGEYYALNKKYYGKSVQHNKQIAFEWARIPHFYTSFYVYKYATGITSAVTIANNILKDKSYVDRYKSFLSAGSSASPYDILKITGVDLAKSEPFEVAMQEFADTLAQLEELYED